MSYICIIDFDRLLRFSTEYQSNDHGECFLRSFLNSIKLNIFEHSTHMSKYSKNLLTLEKYMDTNETIKWA